MESGFRRYDEGVAMRANRAASREGLSLVHLPRGLIFDNDPH